jgi:hypothetical protein
MLPCTLLLLFGRNAIIEYRKGRLGKSFASLGDETISTVVQSTPIDEEILEAESVTKVDQSQKGFFFSSHIICFRNKRNHSLVLYMEFKILFLKFKVMLMVLLRHWNELKSKNIKKTNTLDSIEFFIG